MRESGCGDACGVRRLTGVTDAGDGVRVGGGAEAADCGGERPEEAGGGLQGHGAADGDGKQGEGGQSEAAETTAGEWNSGACDGGHRGRQPGGWGGE